MLPIRDRLRALESRFVSRQKMMTYQDGEQVPEHSENDLLVKISYDPAALKMARINGRLGEL